MRKHGFLTMVVVALVASVTATADATTITGEMWLELETKDASKVILELLKDYSQGGQAASVFAAAGPIKFAGVQTAPFDGDTGLIWATADYRDSEAMAVAQSSQTVKLTVAVATGDSAYAEAALAWDGVITSQSDLIQLPPIDDIIDGRIRVQYTIGGIEVDILGASEGALTLDHAWNGLPSLGGAVEFGKEGLVPQFSGDLLAYSGDFSIGPGAVAATGLDISHEFSFPVDFTDFYDDGLAEVTYAGSLVAKARAVPEPSTFLVWSLLAALGIGTAAYRRKRQVGPATWNLKTSSVLAGGAFSCVVAEGLF